MKGSKLISVGFLGIFLGMAVTGVCVYLDRSPDLPLLGQFISILFIVTGLEINYRETTNKSIEEKIVGDDLNV